ncbi:PREDICTED: UPF0692 protein CG33108 [Nicrophorus vespilloides]|uniref:Actin maturation protease n=1 Tax=Nicrophorus vespilloides TaxID=110193 RepID=A0ABM1N473_NICVS|nr:PREDICTED: UPF0692 protein CG33108 [Nicrophorus vespilloides]
MCYGNPTKETVEDVFQYAKENKYTNNGEIFSVDYMHLLAKKFLPNKIEIYSGKLDDNKIVEFLHSKGLILVPYDCDRDHRPCTKLGHKAHWAVISGMIETDDGIHVFAKHGKSLNTAIWSLQELARSNEQLNEFAPDRKNSDLVYVLPDGGLNGPNGLCSRAVLIYPQ